jgi:hypothetical protein
VDDVTTNFEGLLSLADLLGSQTTDSDKLALANEILTADRSYVPDLDAVNGTDAQTALDKLLGFATTTPGDKEGLGLVAKEIYSNLTPADLPDPTNTTHGYTPWEAFNGVPTGASGDNAEGYASTAYVSKERPAVLGWFDSQKTQGPTVISSFKIDSPDGKMPTEFDLYGYNSVTEVWEFVQAYNHDPAGATSITFDVDTYRAFSGFRLQMYASRTIE